MGTIRILVCTLMGVFAVGCFAFDEIDEGMEKAGHRPPARDNPAAPEATDSASRASAGSNQWWKDARSISSGELDSGIVQCGLPAGTQFMRREDCLSRGGKPAS